MRALLQGLRLAALGLARARGTALTAVLTMGVGLSAAVVVLGVLDAAVRPLPVPGGEDVVQVRLLDARARPATAPAVPVASWAAGPGILSAGAVRPFDVRLTHASAPALRASGAAMSPSVLPLLGVAPALGRIPGEGPSDRPAVVLGWDVWEAMGGDPALLGTRLDLDDAPHTIVGVMPEGFGFPEKQSLWTLLPQDDAEGELVARLARGSGMDEAARALETRLSAVPTPEGVEGPYRVQLRSWTSSRGEGGEAAMFAGLSTLVALLLVVCAANVATLLLVRATERAGVLAVHAALGASRGRLAFQLFAEALLVALAGGLVGLAGGFGVLRWMEATLASHWGYFWMSMEVRPSVVVGTFGAVIAAALLAGTAPALRAMRSDLRTVLAGHGRGAAAHPGRRPGRWFVGAQVALSTTGLVAAAFLGWSFVGLGRTVKDLPLERVALATVTPPPERYPDAASLAGLRADLRAELLRIPGVRAASVSGAVPGFDGVAAPLTLPGRAAGSEPPTALWLAVDPYFTGTYGARVLAGRDLVEADDAPGAPPVVLVTSAFRRRFGTSPGDALRLEGVHGEEAWAEVAGVVEDWYPDRPGVRADRVLVPLAHAGRPRLYLSVRTEGDADRTVAALRPAVARVDEGLPVESPRTLGSLLSWLLRMPRVIAGFGVLGGVAGVLVAGIGLYGVMAFHVRSRLPEIGVRMALGAGAPRILGEVLRESLVRIGPGLAAGLAFGGLASPRLGGLFSTAKPPASLLFAAVVAGMLLVGVAAAIEPAAKAARLDPQRVLRGE